MISEQRWDHEVDVVVAGSGNGGMSAALAAAEAGARTLVVEIGSVTGGSSAMSGGGIAINGAHSYEEFVEITHGMHDADMSRAYFDGFSTYTDWLQSIGAAIWHMDPDELDWTGRPAGMRWWMGSNPNGASEPQCREYFTSLERILARLGGTLLTRTRAMKILTDEDGRITGLRARSWRTSPLRMDGETINIRADNVVLACGGFHQNKELMQRYVGSEADLISGVGSPYNRGEGIALAQPLGAALSKAMSGVYGAAMSAYPARRPMEDPELWETLTEKDKSDLFDLLWFELPPGHIAVNLNGERFVDESIERYRVIQAVARQQRAMGVILFDDAMWEEAAEARYMAPGTGSSEREKLVTRERIEGEILLRADGIEELVDKLAARGPHEVYRENLVKTIEECARAADAGRQDLRFKRTWVRKLEKPPFYAWPFTAGVLYTMGGLAINPSAQVLDGQRAPIPGLYASPPCAGGVFRDYYGGSIASAGVFGFIAGRHAARRLAKAPA